MTRAILSVMAGAVLLAASGPPVRAHHSFAMYDMEKSMAMTGRLIRFIPGANHAQFIFEVVDENGEVEVDEAGEPVVWGVETTTSARLAQSGITVESFPLGTYFSMSLNPLRDGRPFGNLDGAIVLCGTAMPAGGCTRDSGKVFLER